MFPLAPGLGRGGLRGHRRRHLPHARRRAALGAQSGLSGETRLEPGHVPAARAGSEAPSRRRAVGALRQGARPRQRLHPGRRTRTRPADAAAWARRLCDRHEGIGGDGVIVYRLEPRRVRMRLVNADGGEARSPATACAAWRPSRRGRRGLRRQHVVHTRGRPARGGRGRSLAAAATACAPDLGPRHPGERRDPGGAAPPQPRVVDHPLEAAGGTRAGDRHLAGQPALRGLPGRARRRRAARARWAPPWSATRSSRAGRTSSS